MDRTAIANQMHGLSPNGLVYFGECQTMRTDGLGAPIREKGAAVVFGWSQNVSFSGDEAFAKTFFNTLATGVSVSRAAHEMKKVNGYWDRSSDADKEACATYRGYRFHLGTESWKQLMKTLYPTLDQPGPAAAPDPQRKAHATRPFPAAVRDPLPRPQNRQHQDRLPDHPHHGAGEKARHGLHDGDGKAG